MPRKYISPQNTKAIIDVAKMGWPLWMKLKGLDVEVVGSGLQRYEEVRDSRLMICPNHPSETDAEVLFGLSRMVHDEFCFLTAHEIFHGSRGLNRELLPRLGCYSVERGTKDVAAFKTTRDILISNHHKIVGFPEGEISHLNDVVMPLERGLIQMGFSAMDKLRSEEERRSVKILPVAVKYYLSSDVSKQISQTLSQIENEFELCEIRSSSLADRAKRAMLSAVSRLEIRFGISVIPSTNLDIRMVNLRWAILGRVADRLGVCCPRFERQVDCAHMLQSLLYDIHFHGVSKVPVALAAIERRGLYRDLLTVIDLIALEDSFVGKPFETVSDEQIWDIIRILRLITFRKRVRPRKQTVLLMIGEPIVLYDFYELYQSSRASAVSEAVKQLSNQLTSMLNQLDNVFRSR